MGEVDVGPDASDHEVAIGPLGVFVSADEKRQGELFEDVILGCAPQKSIRR